MASYAPSCWSLGRQSHGALGLEPAGAGGCAWADGTTTFTSQCMSPVCAPILLAPLPHFLTLISIPKADQQKAADAHSEPIKNIFLPHAGALLWHVASSWLAVFCGMPVPAAEQRGAGFLVGCPPIYPCACAPLRPGCCGSSGQRHGSAACCLPFSGRGNCRCVMKCCQDLGQEQGCGKEKQKNNNSKHGMISSR